MVSSAVSVSALRLGVGVAGSSYAIAVQSTAMQSIAVPRCAVQSRAVPVPVCAFAICVVVCRAVLCVRTWDEIK